MSTTNFDAFRAELSAIRDLITAIKKKTVRDHALLERCRTLFRTWISFVQPNIEHLIQNKRDLLKLGAELEALANLTLKIKPVSEYRKRLTRAIALADGLVLFLPTSGISGYTPKPTIGDELFIPDIPDLPVNFVPNPLLGWKSTIKSFVRIYPYDKSVFIMIRYRTRNKKLIKEIKNVLSDNGLNGILASEHNLTKDLYNPIACLLCCSKGIAIFDKAEVRQEFNPNVAYELGMIHLLGRDCLILKHKTLNALQTDILMKLYHEYETTFDARTQTQNWINDLSGLV